jgi:hypothetical protein
MAVASRTKCKVEHYIHHPAGTWRVRERPLGAVENRRFVEGAIALDAGGAIVRMSGAGIPRAALNAPH